VVPLAIAVAAAATHGRAHADGAAQDQTEFRSRCAIRLSSAIMGTSPSATLLAATDPAGQVDTMLATPEFQERFSRFVNASFNRIPGNNPEDDAPYWLAKYVLQNNKPWTDLFLGPYDVAATDPNNPGNVTVSNNPDGLGYFRAQAWMIRYAGNELSGLKISTAYHMMQNTIGLHLTAVTTAPGQDISATGRAKQPCAGCHVDPYYALDKVASVLTRRNDTTSPISFDPPTVTSAQILGGITVTTDKDIVTALVKSDAFAFRQCRLAWEYLYARPEFTCDGPVFDKCMAAFTSAGTIQAGIAAIAKDPSYCAD
jgi:hypothetical protein